MSHSATRSVHLRERATIWLLVEIERIALSALPRGRLRKRVLARVNRALARTHLKYCGGNALHYARPVYVKPRQRGEWRRSLKRLLRIGRDLLFALWAIAVIGFWLTIIAALAFSSDRATESVSAPTDRFPPSTQTQHLPRSASYRADDRGRRTVDATAPLRA